MYTVITKKYYDNGALNINIKDYNTLEEAQRIIDEYKALNIDGLIVKLATTDEEYNEAIGY